MSVDQVTSTASGTTSSVAGSGLGSVTGMLQGGFMNMMTSSMNYLNKILPPEKRASLQEKASKFATEKPYLASFLLSQIALSGGPMFLFVCMTLTVVIFALVAGILVGLLGAVIFILIAVGFALAILLPTLFLTTFAGVAVWLWGMGAYYIVKWFNKKEVPGVHKPLGDTLEKATGLGGALNMDAAKVKPDHQQAQQQPNGDGEKTQVNGTGPEKPPRHDTPEKKKKKSAQPSNPAKQVTASTKEVTDQLPTGQAVNGLKGATSQLPTNQVTSGLTGAVGL